MYQFLLYLTGWPLALLLFCGGVYFTVRLKFPQFRLFGESIRVVSEKPVISTVAPNITRSSPYAA